MKRRGMSLLETAVAAAMLAGFLAVCVQYFAVTARHRLALDRRQAALEEAANVMERIMALPSSDLTADSLANISLSAEGRRALPEGELKVDLTEEDTKPSSKRIMVTIRWQDQDGQWTRPARLVAWRYQP